MNQFGGNWTIQKIEIVVDYAKAYLTIMNKYPQFKTLYFDGSAGSGEIFKENETDIEIIKGTAIRVLEIVSPKNLIDIILSKKTRIIKMNSKGL